MFQTCEKCGCEFELPGPAESRMIAHPELCGLCEVEKETEKEREENENIKRD